MTILDCYKWAYAYKERQRMKKKHNPTPWTSNGEGYIYDVEGACISDCNLDGNVSNNQGDTNAAHIVACVNACKGINPKSVKLLLAACQAGLTALGDHLDDCPIRDERGKDCDCGYGTLETAIAQATGQGVRG